MTMTTLTREARSQAGPSTSVSTSISQALVLVTPCIHYRSGPSSCAITLRDYTCHGCIPQVDQSSLYHKIPMVTSVISAIFSGPSNEGPYPSKCSVGSPFQPLFTNLTALFLISSRMPLPISELQTWLLSLVTLQVI